MGCNCGKKEPKKTEKQKKKTVPLRTQEKPTPVYVKR